jgi:hypothetical protein
MHYGMNSLTQGICVSSCMQLWNELPPQETHIPDPTCSMDTCFFICILYRPPVLVHPWPPSAVGICIIIMCHRKRASASCNQPKNYSQNRHANSLWILTFHPLMLISADHINGKPGKVCTKSLSAQFSASKCALNI